MLLGRIMTLRHPGHQLLLVLLLAPALLAQTSAPPVANPQRTAPAEPSTERAADARRHPARRVRPLPRQQRPALLPPRRPRRSGRRSRSPARTRIRFRMLKDDTRIQLDLYANLDVDKILLGATPLKYERELNTVFVDFPETLQGRPRLRDRLPLLGHARASRAGSAASRSARTPPGKPLDQHRLRGRGRQHLVAEQGSVARRGRGDGDQRRRSPTASSTSPTASSSARPISATATRAGTGTCTTRSTTTTCR